MDVGKNFYRNRKALKETFLLDYQRNRIANGHGSEMTFATQDSKRQFQVKGYLQIEKHFEDGTVEVALKQESNLVVSQAETIMPYMTIGTRTMNYIELGDPSPATAPELTDTSLQQTTGQRKSITPTVSGNSISYEAQWLQTEGNGFTYTEAGLFTDPLGTGLLFARKTFDPIVKNNSFSLVFKWGIVFTVSFTGNTGCNGVSLLGSSTITSDYLYTSPAGGETQLVIPIDFTVGAKSLDVFYNGQRLSYNDQYYEAVIGLGKGIIFQSWTLEAGKKIYIVNRKLA